MKFKSFIISALSVLLHLTNQSTFAQSKMYCSQPAVGCASTDLSNYGINSNTNASTIEYDNLVSLYHGTLTRNGDGTYSGWGQGAANNGTGNLTTPSEINKTNFPALRGDILKIAGGSNGSNAGGTGKHQYIVLTTHGLFVWGERGILLETDATTSTTFQKIDVSQLTGADTTGLPTNVKPGDVKMMFGTRSTLAITTCSGDVWVLSTQTDMRGRGASGTNAASQRRWRQVTINTSSDPLTDIVVARGCYNTMFALSSDNKLWTWGVRVYLGNSTSIKSNIQRATQMTLPQDGGVDIDVKMIGMTCDANTTNRITYYVLAKSGKLYALGNNTNRQLGDFTTTTSTSWVRVKYNNNATPDYMDDIVWISANEHDGFANASYRVPAINAINNDKQLWAWGSNHNGMIGMGASSTGVDPGRPGNTTASTDSILAVETGGHTSMIIKQCEKNFGYTGHRTGGSMACGGCAEADITSYDFGTIPVNICGVPSNASINVNPIPIFISSSTTFCFGTDYILQLSEEGTSVTFSINKDPLGIVTLVPDKDNANNDTLKFSQPGTVEIKASMKDICNPVIPIDTIITVTMLQCKLALPDNNHGFVNNEISGNVSTNDVNAAPVKYGMSPNLKSSPSGSTPVISMGSDGKYTFTADKPGKYVYEVSICDIGQISNCLTEELTIWIKNDSTLSNPPMASTDVTSTKKNTAVTIPTLSNDQVGSKGKSLVPSSVTIVSGTAPNTSTEGSLSINSSTGEITFTPVSTFTGIVSYSYEVCDNTSPTPLCSQAKQIIHISGSSSQNATYGADDYANTNFNTPVSGNVKTNDADAEGDNQEITPQTTTKPGVGKLVLDKFGAYTFTPAYGFYGSTNFEYETCDDNATDPVCTKATLYITVNKEETYDDFHSTVTNVQIAGDVSTNDNLPLGYTYGNVSSVVGNPSASVPTLSTDGTYTFKTSVPGVYKFKVDACTPAPGSICITEILTITVVKDVYSANNKPTTTIDYGLMQGHPTTPATLVVNVSNNDKTVNTINLTPALAKPTIVSASNKNGATINVNMAGNVEYTPKAGFYGKDTFMYEICEAPAGTLCIQEYVIITVNEPSTPNAVQASDDYSFTTSGNSITVTAANGLIQNDFSTQTAGTKTVSLKTGVSASPSSVGTLSLSTDGSYTFTPDVSFIGTTIFPYTMCDGTVCTDATLYIQVFSPSMLPISLINFSAKLTNSLQVQLDWTSAQETNNDFYTIKKSNDGINWVVLGNVNGAGNSNHNNHYNMIDPLPSEGINYYTLSQTDLDGTVAELGMRTIILNPVFNELIKVYPNPSNGVIHIEGAGVDFSYIITDVQGRTIARGEFSDKSTIENLSRGLYFIRLQIGNRVQSYKIVVE